MQIVDAQIHLWATGLPSNKAHIQETSFTAKQAITLMDEAGVHAAIIHPPSWDPKSHELALAAVNDYPNRFASKSSYFRERDTVLEKQCCTRLALYSP